MTRVALAFLTAFAAIAAPALTPVPVHAQDDEETPSASQAAPGELIYRRETFVYPTSARRNPFESGVDVLEESGPLFEDLDLVGIIFGGSQGSVATIIDRSAEKRYRIRRGDSVGNASVVEIRPDAVVFRVTQFGVTRSETLRIRRDEEEEQG